MIGKHLLKGSIVGAFAFGSIALSDQPDAHATTTIPYGQYLKLGRQTSQPIGHYDFCRAMPSECDSRFDTVPRAALTESLWQFIVTTDRTINNSIAPVSDEEQWGGSLVLRGSKYRRLRRLRFGKTPRLDGKNS